MRPSSTLPAFVAVGLLLAPLLSIAASFPDVPSTHPYRTAIEGLADRGVISGNPDGTFRPSDPVNRAALLKMLYKASGRTPGEHAGCFPDVERGSWYEPFVCDAVAQGFVKGYTDGTFKPSRQVSQSESIKMTLTVMGFAVPELTDDAGRSIPYGDVSLTAWYAKYVATALKAKMLPLSGQDTSMFYPDEPTSRGEAAAYIWAALRGASLQSSSAVSSAAVSSEAVSSAQSSSRKSVSSFDDTGASAHVLTMTFPFTDTQTFDKKQTFSYRFHLDTPMVASVTASPREGSTGDVNCTLFHLDKDGLSVEYYLGYVEAGICHLRTALAAGDYQLQLQPTVPNTSYLVETAVGKGDGNDGFSQAVSLDNGKSRTDFLDANDYEDWFTFTVTTQKQMTLSLTATDKLRCLIEPAANVDMYGFDEPTCNNPFLYPVGTYYVGIGHAYPGAVRQTYAIQLK